MQSVTPPRAPESVTGLSFTDLLPDALCQEREDAIVKELLSGNVPAFMRSFVEVDASGKDATGNERKLVFHVMADYLCVGDDDDFVRVPLNPLSAQAVADEFGCTLPTKKMVDIIWKAAAVHLDPSPIPPDAKMSTTKRFVEHNKKVETARKVAGHALGKLLAGHKKDVVVTNRLLDSAGKFLKKVAIYGWQWLTGKVIQDLNPTSHDDKYADYSHGIRLVALDCTLEGSPANVHEILADPILWALLSDEGPMKFLKYPKKCPKCDRMIVNLHEEHVCNANVVKDVHDR
jgi:hypothetical protein